MNNFRRFRDSLAQWLKNYFVRELETKICLFRLSTLLLVRTKTVRDYIKKKKYFFTFTFYFIFLMQLKLYIRLPLTLHTDKQMMSTSLSP